MNPNQQSKNKRTYIKYQIQDTNELIDHQSKQLTQRFKSQFVQLRRFNQTKNPKSIIISKPKGNNNIKNNKVNENNNQSSLKLQDQQQSKLTFIDSMLNQYIKQQQNLQKCQKSQKIQITQQANHRKKKVKQQINQIQIQQEIKNNLNKRGLALISSLLIQVLEQEYKSYRRFTCVQLSNKILIQYCNRYQEMQISQKQKNTIKRRVYDSINVLMALGKIKKDGKQLFLDIDNNKMGFEIIGSKSNKINQLENEYINKQKIVNKYKDYYAKLVALRQRNSSLAQQKDDGQSRSISTFLTSKNYKFPLLFIYTNKESKINITIDKQFIERKQQAIQYQQNDEIDQILNDNICQRQLLIIDSKEGGVNMIADLDALGHIKSLNQNQNNKYY